MRVWKVNPVADIKPSKVKKIVSSKRKPFTEKKLKVTSRGQLAAWHKSWRNNTC